MPQSFIPEHFYGKGYNFKKIEARSTKFETRSKYEFSNIPNTEKN